MIDNYSRELSEKECQRKEKEHARRRNEASALLDLSGVQEDQLEPLAASSKPSWDCLNDQCHEMFAQYSSLQKEHNQHAEKLKSIEAECQALRGENQVLKLKANSLSDEPGFQYDDEKVKNLTGLPSLQN